MTKKCVCCGGGNLIAEVKLIDKSHNHTESIAQVSIDREPTAWVFKGTVRADVYGEVCEECGYLHLFVNKTAELREARDQRQSNDPTGNAGPRYRVCSNCHTSHRQEDCPKCGFQAR